MIYDHFSSLEGIRVRDKTVSTLNEECQTGQSPCDCPICTRLQQRVQAEYVLEMARTGRITGADARNYFIGKGITTWLEPNGDIKFQFPDEANPGKAAVLVTATAEPEKSETEKRWSAIADELKQK